MNKVRISAVSYTNSKPFVYGLKHSGLMDQIDLSLDIPADCAQKLIENQVDVGLVPVAALLNIPDYQIISDYCIGATGAVDSVFLFSDKPVHEIQRVKLDQQSRTSNSLAKVLFKNHWHQEPEFVAQGSSDAFVQIGDRTFGQKENYAYVFDLAEEWFRFSGLPFVFAVWAANKQLPHEFLNGFNQSLKYGLDHREEVIQSITVHNDFDIRHYLMNSIDFNLNEDKRIALGKFLSLIKELDVSKTLEH